MAAPSGAPVITAPSGTASVSPLIVWGTVSGASGYEVWISDLSSGQSPLIDVTVSDTTFTPATPLPLGDSFTVWVRGSNVFGNGPWSAGQIFATGTGAVAAPSGVPVITAPSGTASVSHLVVWGTVSGASGYEVWISDLSSGQSPLLDVTVSGTTFTPVTPLPLGDSFTVWVRAQNAFGNGPWSAGQIFATGTGPVAAPTDAPNISAPSGSGNILNPVVVWGAVLQSSSYEVWISDLTSGQSPLLDAQAAGTTFTPATPLPLGDSFTVWVRGQNVFGNGPWSAGQIFATGAGPVAAPTDAPNFISPAGIANIPAPLFSWAAVANASYYDLWVDDETTGTSQILRQPQIFGTSFTPATPLPAHNFTAWLRASNVFGSGPWSAAQDFAVSAAAPPMIVQPASVTAEASSPAGAIVNYPPATVTDIAGATDTVGYSQNSATVFPLGTTTVTVTASNGGGGIATATFNVIVQDTTAPVLNLPLTGLLAEATSPNGANVVFGAAAPTATDAVTLLPVITCVPVSGSLFPMGLTTVTVTAADTSGNVGTGTFDVFVEDMTAPVVTPPQNVIAEAADINGAIVAYATATATDAVTPSPIISYSQDSATLFPLGVTTVTVNATDIAGNVGSAAFTVTVQNTIPPVVAPLADMTAEATGPGGAAVAYPAATATDTVTALPALEYSVPSGSVFPLGTTVVTVTATDDAGNAGTASFNITVQDTTAPVVVPPSSLTVFASDANGAVVVYPPAIAADAVSANPVITYRNNSGTVFSAGTTAVTVSATDDAGNVGTATFNVTVLIIALTAPADVVVEATSPDGAIAVYPPATAVDAVDIAPIVNYSQESGTVFSLGTTVVTVSVTDSFGNTAMAAFNVIVQDTTPPLIIPPADLVLVGTNPLGLAVAYPAATATDAVTANPALIYSVNSGSTFLPGTTLVIATATDDAGNSSTATFNVTVQASALAVTAPSDVTIQATDLSGATVFYPSATVWDSTTATPSVAYTQESGSVFPLGTTVVTVNASDETGNAGTASFNVIVQNMPVITLPEFVVESEATGPAGAIVTYAPAMASDLLDPAPILSYSIDSGASFPLGTTTVVVTATDAGGSVSTTSFDVTVLDTTPRFWFCRGM